MLIRVSTDQQDVARQRADAEKLKQKYGATIVRTLELEGVSGTDTFDNADVRLLLNSMGDVDGIGVSALDRLFRPKRYTDFGILQPFQDWGKCIWSVREGMIDPRTSEGYDKCMTAGTRAGAEWRDLRDRTTGGRHQKLEAGLVDCGSVPYGYIYRNKHQEGGRAILLDERPMPSGMTRADVIRLIFKSRLHGMGMSGIALMLAERGILSAGNGRPGTEGYRKPGGWSHTTIRQLLRNTAYIGKYKRAGFVIDCPAIVDMRVFETIQKMGPILAHRNTGRPSRQYLLHRFLWCAKCGRRCLATCPSKQAGTYYVCGNVTKRPVYTRHCEAKGILQARLDEAAWSALWGLLRDPARLIKLGRAFHAGRPGEKTQSEQLATERERLRLRIARTQRMMRDGSIGYEEGASGVRQDQLQLSRVEKDMISAGRIAPLPTVKQAEATLREFTHGRLGYSFEIRRAILERIHDLHMTYFNGQMEISGTVPMSSSGVSGVRKNPTNGLNATYPFHAAIPFRMNVKVA